MIIEVENLKKSYGKVEAVKGISFQVEEGSLFSFLGPNGAGKAPPFLCSPQLWRLTAELSPSADMCLERRMPPSERRSAWCFREASWTAC